MILRTARGVRGSHRISLACTEIARESFGGESNSPVAEWLYKGFMAVVTFSAASAASRAPQSTAARSASRALALASSASLCCCA
eukprot:260991-Prorocentrum_minimum.AAC.3